MSALPKIQYSLEDYFALERDSAERYEWWEGEVFAMSRVRRILPTFFVLILFLCGFSEPAQENWVAYQPAVVELKGVLKVRRYHGPPNYGENPNTDSKEMLPILILNKLVNVRGNPAPKAKFDKQSVEGVRELQLVLPVAFNKLIGKTVIVKGSLFHAFTGHHHTDVLMDVSSIEKLPRL